MDGPSPRSAASVAVGVGGRFLGAIMLGCVLGGAAVVVAACHSSESPSPSSPPAIALANGRWSAGGGTCLSVSDVCDLVAGCGHGQFARPSIRADGTFDVDGTYRIEAGPVRLEPAPPAHFSGTLGDGVLVLRVVPTADSLQPATFTLRPSTQDRCLVPCL